MGLLESLGNDKGVSVLLVVHPRVRSSVAMHSLKRQLVAFGVPEEVLEAARTSTNNLLCRLDKRQGRHNWSKVWLDRYVAVKRVRFLRVFVVGFVVCVLAPLHSPALWK